ncbi:hypothetical protein LguiA_002120 [Lonicera macranthoides]
MVTLNSSNILLLSFSFTLILTLALLPVNGAVPAEESACNGSIAECREDLEILTQSVEEIRRVLQEKKYISPGALKRDRPVCNGGASGESYSRSGGCLPPPSNSYDRGCSKYYRCSRDS